MSEWTVRTMDSAETVCVAGLVTRAYATLYDDAAAIDGVDLSENLGSGKATTLVVHDNSRSDSLVGCVTVHWPAKLEGGRSGPPQSASIARLAVDPDYRNRGIANVLVATAEAMAREAGATALVLQTDEDMAAARRLYARRGYQRLASLDFEIEPGLRTLGMQRTLTGQGRSR